MDFITVTIDGPAGAGKSTVALGVSKVLGFRSLNVGQIYRAIAFKYLKLGSPKIDSEEDIKKFVDALNVRLDYIDNEQHTFCDGEDITHELHTQRINKVVADIAPFPEVRAYVIKIQRNTAAQNNIVADGRDVGTNVLPGARFKIYLTASIEVRAERRVKELLEYGDNSVTYEQILKEMSQRDDCDANRKHGKMKAASDAIIIDTTDMTIDEVIEAIVEIVTKGK